MEAVPKNSKSTELCFLVILVIIVVWLEATSARLAYETVGAIASAWYWLAIGINLPILLIAFRSRFAAAIGVVLLGLVLIPYQVVLAERLWQVQLEATRIVAFAYETKISKSRFPASLVDYTFYDPAAKPFIQEYRPDADAGGFILCYSVGSESTSHCYSPQTGWTYYAD